MQNHGLAVLPDMAQCERMKALRTAIGACASMRRLLDVDSTSALIERIAHTLRSATSSAHTFILLRSVDGYTLAGGHAGADLARLAGQAARALDQLSADAPCDVALDGFAILAVPMSADGRNVLGALCLDVQPDTWVDHVLLAELAAGSAVGLQRLGDDAGARAADAQREPPAMLNDLPGQLLDEGGLLRTIIDNMPDHIYAKDCNGRFLVGNMAAARSIFGVADPQALVGKTDLDMYPIECGQRFFTDEQQIIRSGVPIIDQIEENVNPEGIRRFFSTTKFPFHDQQGKVRGIVGISRDVTVRVTAEQAIRLRDQALESSQDGIVITCCTMPGEPIVYTNPAFERITGFNLAQAQLCGIERLLVDQSQDGRKGQEGQVDDALVPAHGSRTVLSLLRQDGSPFWAEVRLAVIRNSAGGGTHNVFTITDITAARQAEEHLALLASHDALTGLPNRRMLMERLGHAISVADRNGLALAVAFIDLDGLKRINDEFGHDAGDQLLRTVAQRVADSIRRSDTLARLGGDEFVLLTMHKGGSERELVLEVLEKIQSLIRQPIVVRGVEVRVTCSIGVSVLQINGNEPETLLRLADEAMYVAKKAGRDRIVFCAPGS